MNEHAHALMMCERAGLTPAEGQGLMNACAAWMQGWWVWDWFVVGQASGTLGRPEDYIATAVAYALVELGDSYDSGRESRDFTEAGKVGAMAASKLAYLDSNIHRTKAGIGTESLHENVQDDGRVAFEPLEDDPEMEVISRAEAAHIVAEVSAALDPIDGQIVGWLMEGLEQHEIGVKLGLTRSAISWRVRKRIKPYLEERMEGHTP